MSIKQRIEKLEGKAGAGYCIVFPMYRNKDGVVEGYPQLPDDQVASIEFLVEGDGEGFVVERETGEALDALEKRAYADAVERASGAPIMRRGWHLV
ncbi:MAG: hypothetical protein AAFQ79_02385 [Pseudomonadota bacterium]